MDFNASGLFKMADDIKVEPDVGQIVGQIKDIDPHPLYTPANLQGQDYDRDGGCPREFPFTRGVQATM